MGELQSLHDIAEANLHRAEILATERRELAAKLRDAERDAMQVQQTENRSPPSDGIDATAPSQQMVQPQAAEAQAVAQSRAAQALREIRLNAEEQLAWIGKRVRMSELASKEGPP